MHLHGVFFSHTPIVASLVVRNFIWALVVFVSFILDTAIQYYTLNYTYILLGIIKVN